MSITKKNVKSTFVFSVFVLPALGLFLTFVIVPLVMALIRSFSNWNIFASEISFVGIRNYFNLLQDGIFLNSLLISCYYAIILVVVTNTISFFIATLIESGIRFKGLVRNLFFIPNIISGIFVAFTWKFILLGIYPEIVKMLGLEFLDISWFATKWSSFSALSIVAVWQSIGFMILLYTAGLQTVPQYLYESASLDGASWWKKIRHITLPMIAPSITINLFISIANGFKAFEIPYALNNGGPSRLTETLTVNIYNEAYVDNYLGVACAKGIILLLVVSVITIIQIKITSRKEMQQ